MKSLSMNRATQEENLAKRHQETFRSVSKVGRTLSLLVEDRDCMEGFIL